MVSFTKVSDVVEIVGSGKRKVGDRERTNAPPVKLATSILISRSAAASLELHFPAAAMFSNICCFIGKFI